MKKLTIMIAATVLATAQAQAADMEKGKKVYDTACFACHATGAANAPKLGDKAAWVDRIKQGMDTLNTHALKGFKGAKGFMPAKGGRSDLSDADVAAAVAYMVDKSK
jgi:cytochrome c5